MTSTTEVLPLDIVRGNRRAVDFLALTKPRVVLLVLLTTAIGFYLGTRGGMAWVVLLKTLIGTGLAAGGTMALNQFLERDQDALMRRTQHRPLPDGRLQPNEALAFGIIITAMGVVVLMIGVNPLSGVVTATISVTYLCLYTPLKLKTSLCSVAGAIPGALPPVTGWVAARGSLGIEAGVLFAIMFLWQLPHSLAIAWLYRDDYARAGFRLLPVINPDGASTSRQILHNCLALLAVSLLPTVIGLAGQVYFVVALGLGVMFVGFAVQLARTRSLAAARHLFMASLVYLLAQFVMMALDKV